MLGPPSPCPAWQVTRGEGPAMLGQRSPSRCLCSACRSPSRCLRVLFELGALFGLRSRLAQGGRPAVLGLQSPSRCLGVRRCLACRSPSRCLRVLFELGALSRPDFNTPWQVARSGGPAVLGSLEVLSAGAGAAVATGPGVSEWRPIFRWWGSERAPGAATATPPSSSSVGMGEVLVVDFSSSAMVVAETTAACNSQASVLKSFVDLSQERSREGCLFLILVSNCLAPPGPAAPAIILSWASFVKYHDRWPVGVEAGPAGDGAAPAAPSAGAPQADNGLEQQQGEAEGEHRGGQQPRSGNATFSFADWEFSLAMYMKSVKFSGCLDRLPHLILTLTQPLMSDYGAPPATLLYFACPLGLACGRQKKKGC